MASHANNFTFGSDQAFQIMRLVGRLRGIETIFRMLPHDVVYHILMQLEVADASPELDELVEMRK